MSPRCSLAILITALFATTPGWSVEPAPEFFRAYCVDCHSGDKADAGLDLAKLKQQLDDGESFRVWVKIHDRLAAGEMPPKDSKQPPPAELTKFTKQLQIDLLAAEKARIEREGRTPLRRMTRSEYENTLRDLLQLDGIPLQAGLPEDGSAYNFDKNAAALDISHVNMSKYVEAADAALDMAIAVQPQPPLRQTHRFSLARHIYHILMNGDAVMLRDGKPDSDFSPGEARAHVGAVEHINVLRNSLKRNASVGVFRHEDESFKPYFYDFAALYPGRYRIKTSFWSFGWDKGTVLPGRGVEAARLSVVQLQDDGRGGGHPSYILGYYDAPPNKPQQHEVTTWLNFKDTIGFNTASLAPVANYYKPKRSMEFTGPGIACDYIEIEGPLHDVWPPEAHRRLFGDLPLVAFDPKAQAGVRPPKRKLVRRETQAPNQPDPPVGHWTVASLWPVVDADRLLASFLPRAFRRPVSDETRQEYLAIFQERLAAGECFEIALRQTYRAALCSPQFLYHLEQSDYFDDHALAARLSYFLWNSMPDETLLTLADGAKLRPGKTLREEVERMLSDPRSQRFVDDFLGQWLNLRKIAANDPDRKLYPEFSPYLQDSMMAESRAYFRELLDKDLNASYLVRSDFAMLNEKLATLYGVPGVVGSQIRRVPLPAGCPRGAFLTQAAVLKVTANGTTTSPVPRGAFVMARFLGQPPEPPPPNIPAVEPDVQGATTIREQLDKHRSIAVCASCHSKIDPPGFALESFDVIGGARDRYRSIGEGDTPERGAIDKFIGIQFKLGPKVDSSGMLADGRTFANISAFQELLAADTQRLLKNLAEQFVVYATGRPIGFGDRGELNALVNRTQQKGGGIRTLLHEVVQSKLFLPSGPVQAPRPKMSPTIVPATTPTHQNPPHVPVAVSVKVESTKPPLIESPASERQTIRYRLMGLGSAEQLDDLREYLTQASEFQLLELDEKLHEITLSYDMRRLFPQSPANHQPKPETLQQQIDNRLRQVSFGMFTIKPLLGESRAKLKREELAVSIPDCKACRLNVCQTAAKIDGVEQSEFDRQQTRLIVWLDPDKCDLEKLREGLKKAKIEFPK